jgi:cytoskeletal protein CcmA (bactofilin family)
MFGKKATSAAEPTVIGRGSVFEGNIRASGHIQVDGHIDGTLHVDGQVSVGPQGVITGEVMADELVIGGRVQGKAHARGHLHVASGGSVRGEVRYGTLQIDRGGVIDGTTAAESESEELATEQPQLPHRHLHASTDTASAARGRERPRPAQPAAAAPVVARGAALSRAERNADRCTPGVAPARVASSARRRRRQGEQRGAWLRPDLRDLPRRRRGGQDDPTEPRQARARRRARHVRAGRRAEPRLDNRGVDRAVLSDDAAQ